MFMQCVDVLVCCFRFSYHRTEGQELSTLCVGRGTKASVFKLLYNQEDFHGEVPHMHILFMVHFKSFSYWYWGFLCLIVSLFYVVNCLTPYFSDDWHYCMMIGPDGEEDKWIENMRDVLVSNYYHYFQVNGRVVPHVFLMTFDALLGKNCFNIFNAFLFGAYLHLLTLNFVQEHKNSLMGLAISASLTLCFMCGFTNEFLWMSGVFNYEFVAVLVLLFNYLLNIEIHSKVWMPLLFLYGVISGWTNEAVVIGLSCIYMFTYIRKWKDLKWPQVVLLAGFVLGVTLCVFSPGSMHRALGHGTSEEITLASSMLKYVSSLCGMYNLRVFFIMFIVWAIVKKMKKEWLIGVIVSVLFVAFTGHNSGHSRFGIEFFSLIIILCVFPYNKLPRYVEHVVISVLIVNLLVCLPYCIQNSQEFKNVEKQIKETQDGIIQTNEVDVPFYAKRFVLYWIYPEKSDYAFVYNDWYTSMLTRYYGLQNVKLCFLPENFVHDVQRGVIDDTFDLNQRYPFYVCKWHGESDISSIRYVLGESCWKSFPVLRTMERFSAKEIVGNIWLVLKINGSEYLFVKKNSMIQDRVIDIRYE